MMKFLISNLWLLYLAALVLAGIMYAVIDRPLFELKYCILTAAFAAVPDLIALSGIRLFQKGNMIPAVIIAMLCVAAVITAGVICFANAGYGPAGTAGIAAAVLGVLSVILCCVSFSGDPKRIILTACCLCGMLGVNYITGFLAALIMGFQRA